MRHQSRQENIVYWALWGILFITPLLSLYMRTANNTELTFDWQEVFMVWRQYAIYLLLFLLHNYILAPLLIYKQKWVLYLSLMACMLGCFVFYQCQSRPDNMKRGPRHMVQHEQRIPHERMHDGPPEADFYDHEPPPFEKPMRKRHPVMFGQHEIVGLIIIILMCGMNLGIKLYFKTRGDQKKLLRLEKQNLEQQLEYLKYQINPHFFMNTLNNIHALVDIDAEKAKSTILELSKMMRFILYEGDKKGVPLSREFDFIRNYITLMRLRYTDKVHINVDLPQQAPDRQLPPLMLITFIENAFKHGISYQHDSFIDISVTIHDEHLTFRCHNTKADTPNTEKGGVGLANVKQRLNLLYDHDYTLAINDEADHYNVELTIPLL
jgi:two-component sensor histidine kinase